MLVTMLTSSTAFAAGGLKFRNIDFNLGSLIATGLVTGLGNTDVTIVLEGSGPADILCVNNGTNIVPGQSSPKVTATGEQLLDGDNDYDKNGRASFNTVASTDEPLPWDEAGCPNSNWVGKIDFVYWDAVTISVYSTSTGDLLAQQKYKCVTTRYPSPTITCDPV